VGGAGEGERGGIALYQNTNFSPVGYGALLSKRSEQQNQRVKAKGTKQKDVRQGLQGPHGKKRTNKKSGEKKAEEQSLTSNITLQKTGQDSRGSEPQVPKKAKTL